MAKKGLLFAARQLGEALADDPDFWLGGWEFSDYDRFHREGSALGILDDAAHGDPFIALCLTKWNEVTTRHNPPRELEERKSVDEVIQKILASTVRCMWLRSWGKSATTDDRKRIAGLLADHTAPMILENALICLAATGLPEFDESMSNLVFHESDNVRDHAIQVFSHHCEPGVRLAGLALLEKKGELEAAIELL